MEALSQRQTPRVRCAVFCRLIGVMLLSGGCGDSTVDQQAVEPSGVQMTGDVAQVAGQAGETGRVDEAGAQSSPADTDRPSVVPANSAAVQIDPMRERVRSAMRLYAESERRQDAQLWERADRELDELAAAAMPGLIESLSAPERVIREQASVRVAQLIEHLQEPQPLLNALQDDSVWVRVNLASALSFNRESPEEVVPVLQKLLGSPNVNLQRQAAVALGNYGESATQATQPLTQLLTHSDALVRQSAATALGAIGRPARSALPRLQQLLAEPDPGTRQAAESAIQLIQFESESGAGASGLPD